MSGAAGGKRAGMGAGGAVKGQPRKSQLAAKRYGSAASWPGW